ncbi:DoxX family protein [Chitinophaga rhizophila]|uniref:DoxX family protein n=1 Tax=Chitinophaga rhizophila TaxID=2866212 RepID=A0ABS7G788_9BACT|nr:DoxX family protein [Chitinophaga rhizophila]MBW8683000.1 DoxX family protein [Chitinophaga rhizophila]
MKKRNKIIYWIFTCWLALGMVSTAVVQLMKLKDEVDMMTHLGYPVYFLTILGIWKLLGVLAILLPRLPILKEWAYAGFFFAMSGAAISHITMGDSLGETAPSLLLLVLTVISWYFRPAERKVGQPATGIPAMGL